MSFRQTCRQLVCGWLATLLFVLVSACAGQNRSEPLIATGNPPPLHLTRIEPPPLPKPQPVVDHRGPAATHISGSLPPLATTDVWERIQNGLMLRGHEDQNAVRGMVQFFAGQRRHLRESAERAQPYLRHIVENIDARNMPTEFALIPLVESSFDPFAGGGRRASGLWQFMPVTAQRFGLSNSEWYEGRRDVLLSTRAALDYLAWLHGRFDDWLLAMAAYNCGEGCVDRAIAKAAAKGLPKNFWHLDLPTETKRYIPKVLALAELVAEADRFNITWPKTPDRPAFVAVELPARTALVTAADMMDITVQDLRQLNPALRGNITRPKGPHVLLVPANRAERFQTALAQIRDPDRLRWVRHRVRAEESLQSIASRYNVSKADITITNELASDRLSTGQRIWIPKSPALPKARTAKRRPNHSNTKIYRVVSGDSLWSVAKKHGISVAQLGRWNDLGPTAGLHPGQTLRVGKQAARTVKTKYHRVKSGENLWKIARLNNTSVSSLRQLNSLSASGVLKPGQKLLVASKGPQTVYYQVREGDSLWSIASRYNVPVTELKAWNSLGGRALIKPGQKLKILVDSTG